MRIYPWNALLLALVLPNHVAATSSDSISLIKETFSNISANGYVGIEHRYFWQSPLQPQQSSNQSSINGQVELYWQSPDGQDSLTITPFYRHDFVDSQRSHLEFKEAYWLHVDDNSELTLGSKIVFWGITESRHLVDVINQIDLIESPTGEDKLGQPMLQYTWIEDWGSVEFYALPYFREPVYTGKEGRLRALSPISEQVIYQSSKAQNHQDFALRFASSVGDWDIGISAFKGTERQAEFVPMMGNDNTLELAPFHRQISQVSVDLQATIDDFLWKFEGLYLQQDYLDHPLVKAGLLQASANYFAATAGFEYTLVGINDSQVDLGLLFEYNYDQRVNSPFADTLFLATRVALNDFSSSVLLMGFNYDRATHNRSGLIEASTRLGDNMKLALEAWWFESDNQRSAMYYINRDDFLALKLNYYF